MIKGSYLGCFFYYEFHYPKITLLQLLQTFSLLKI